PQKVGRTVENVLFVDTHAMILSSMVAITTNYLILLYIITF
ncbi:MAG: hypothetical protein G01um101448_1217, partial [Parcubacteria group bacterium Gr01-1014_48]